MLRDHAMVTIMVMRRARATLPPETISAAEFKAKCLDLMDTVAATGASIVVTKRGRPVARLSPVRARRASGLGFMKGRIRILGDIVSPLDTTWDADS
jgi:prevent-host-death family protein